jgi:hypothetical protein
MAGYDPIRDGQDLSTAGVELRLVQGERVGVRRHVLQPPEMGEDIGAVIGPDHERGIFFGVAGGAQHGDARDNVILVPVILPEIPGVPSSKIHDLGVREEGDVHRMVGMMMTDKDMGDLLRVDPGFGEPL